ncbi:MAG TPA: SIS domain-containing protein [Candidatus Aminicenantes bacterium]|nr:SIS domain-containing protein [Candidatus Aminicenantes bacterium]
MTLIDAERVRQRARLLAALNEGEGLRRAGDLLAAALARGGKALAFGNGGSATQSSHFAAELVNKFLFRRPALPALALSSDVACLTSIANDEEYRFVFSRQVEAFGRPGDAALGLTTGGASANVLLGLAKARELGLATIALCGRRDRALRDLGLDAVVAVDSDETPAIQELHLFALHVLAETVESKLFGGNP